MRDLASQPTGSSQTLVFRPDPQPNPMIAKEIEKPTARVSTPIITELVHVKISAQTMHACIQLSIGDPFAWLYARIFPYNTDFEIEFIFLVA